MKIIKLVLFKYKRLLLNNIDYIEITPEQKSQIILGSNGSGKSSIMKELNPMPAISTEFMKDGYKLIEIEHGNNIYRLKSDFSNKSFYIFEKNGENLNKGGTISVYRELVKQEFNLTQDIVDLLIGVSKFTTMSIGDRRKWFTILADCDYTYAITYYQRLKEQLRDLQGAVKLNQSRLVQETDKVISESEELSIKNELTELNNALRFLLESKTNIKYTYTELVDEINTIDNELHLLSIQLLEARQKFPNYNMFNSEEEIEAAIIDNTVKVETLNNKKLSVCSDIENKQKTLDVLKKSNLKSIEEINSNIYNLDNEIDSYYKQVKHTFKFDNNEQAYSSLMTIYESIVDVCTNIEHNEDKRYSRENYNKLLLDIDVLTKEIATINNSILFLNEKKLKLEHLKEHNKQDCPKCKHIWIKDYSEKEYQEVISQLKIAEDEINRLNSLYNNKLIEKEKTIEYFNIYKQYNNITNTWNILNPVWEYITLSSMIFNNPKQIIMLLEDIKYDLQLYIKIDSINILLKESNELKELLNKNQESSVESLEIEVNKYNTELQHIILDIDKYKATINTLVFYKNTSSQIKKFKHNIENLLATRTTNISDLDIVLKRDYLNELIEVIRLEISKKESIISKVDIQKALVNNLEKDIKDNNELIEVLKLAVKELSPGEGLIAKGLSGFINHFVSQINNFIKKIWLYRLELKPIMIDDIDGVDLDYRFAVNINDNNTSSDISNVSSAMKEVIDLSFKIIIMQYLGLSDYPVYFDEFGVNMDVAHRQAAFNIINTLITSSNFSQVFIISHYEQSYGSLKNSDILVLCQNNINVPKDSVFNKHVVIK